MLAKRLGTRPNTISKWRGRFARLGMKGLRDAPRPGAPKRYVDLREKVLKTLETPPPKGQAAWDGLDPAGGGRAQADRSGDGLDGFRRRRPYHARARLKDQRNDFEDVCLARLKEALPEGVAVTILADS